VKTDKHFSEEHLIFLIPFNEVQMRKELFLGLACGDARRHARSAIHEASDVGKGYVCQIWNW